MKNNITNNHSSQENNNNIEICQDRILMVNERSGNKPVNTENTRWIIDSGTSVHITNSKDGMYNLTRVEGGDKLETVNGDEMRYEYEGQFRGTFTDKNGFVKRIVLDEVAYCPSAQDKLMSQTFAIAEDYDLSNEKRTIILTKGDIELRFKDVIKTKKGRFLCAMDFYPIKNMMTRNDLVLTSRDNPKLIIYINEFH